MRELFPTFPSFIEERLLQRFSQEWIAPTVPHKNQYGTYKMLPAGKPDSLLVEILHFEEGTERCTAAIYGEHAYVLHYDFKAHVPLQD